MTFNIGKPSDGVTDGQRIQRLYLYLNQMADKLNYALNNMDEQNLTRTFLASLTNGGDSDQQSTKGLKTEQVIRSTVQREYRKGWRYDHSE